MRLTSRWLLLAGDAARSRGRLALMVIAMAAGLFAVAAISTAYVILGRELNRSYLATRPPAALIDVDHVDDADIAALRSQPGVAWVEQGGRLWARIQVAPQTWVPALLFVVPDFTRQHLDIVTLESGRWPAGDNEIVIERAAMPLAGATLGRALPLQTTAGALVRLTVSGIVYDPSLAPAPQQQVIYGFISPATFARLRDSNSSALLKIDVAAAAHDPARSEAIVLGMTRLLTERGHTLGEVRLPPQQHPHWGLMRNVINMLLAFGLLTSLLGVALTAALIADLLQRQARQIGVMKAIGARDRQIIGLYLCLVAAIACSAVGSGLPAGYVAGRALARWVAHTLNVDLANLALPGWLYAAQIAGGLGLPLLAALQPIRRVGHRPVRVLLDNCGATNDSLALGSFSRWIARRVQPWPAVTMAMRNSLRRRSRLALTLGILTTAGALFIASLNVSAAWQSNAAAAAAERPYDVEVEFLRRVPTSAAVAIASRVPGVARAESFTQDSVAVVRGDGVNLTHTFADGEHGSLKLDILPSDSHFFSPQLIEGRWLSPFDDTRVVLNQQAGALFFPGRRLGDSIQVLVRGQVVTASIVGWVREHLSGATLYMTAPPSDRGLSGGLRLELRRGVQSVAQVTAGLERALGDAGYQVVGMTTKAQVARALNGHVFTLTVTLIVLSLLMALIGMLGLAAAMSTGVLERRRELAVMRAIGASSRTIRLSVIGEGVVAGLTSVGPASLLSVPATLLVAKFAGVTASGSIMRLLVSETAIPLWLGMVLVGAVFACDIPARTAARITVRDALAYQ